MVDKKKVYKKNLNTQIKILYGARGGGEGIKISKNKPANFFNLRRN